MTEKEQIPAGLLLKGPRRRELARECKALGVLVHADELRVVAPLLAKRMSPGSKRYASLFLHIQYGTLSQFTFPSWM